ncbi:unnamed protein product [Peniophora sp. CBMAI 1063]|nr:unnamed protein product [Peniophora sp. CBMAI 1063]
MSTSRATSVHSRAPALSPPSQEGVISSPAPIASSPPVHISSPAQDPAHTTPTSLTTLLFAGLFPGEPDEEWKGAMGVLLGFESQTSEVEGKDMDVKNEKWWEEFIAVHLETTVPVYNDYLALSEYIPDDLKARIRCKVVHWDQYSEAVQSTFHFRKLRRDCPVLPPAPIISLDPRVPLPDLPVQYEVIAIEEQDKERGYTYSQLRREQEEATVVQASSLLPPSSPDAWNISSSQAALRAQPTPARPTRRQNTPPPDGAEIIMLDFSDEDDDEPRGHLSQHMEEDSSSDTPLAAKYLDKGKGKAPAVPKRRLSPSPESPVAAQPGDTKRPRMQPTGIDVFAFDKLDRSSKEDYINCLIRVLEQNSATTKRSSREHLYNCEISNSHLRYLHSPMYKNMNDLRPAGYEYLEVPPGINFVDLYYKALQLGDGKAHKRPSPMTYSWLAGMDSVKLGQENLGPCVRCAGLQAANPTVNLPCIKANGGHVQCNRDYVKGGALFITVLNPDRIKDNVFDHLFNRGGRDNQGRAVYQAVNVRINVKDIQNAVRAEARLQQEIGTALTIKQETEEGGPLSSPLRFASPRKLAAAPSAVPNAAASSSHASPSSRPARPGLLDRFGTHEPNPSGPTRIKEEPNTSPRKPGDLARAVEIAFEGAGEPTVKPPRQPVQRKAQPAAVEDAPPSAGPSKKNIVVDRGEGSSRSSGAKKGGKGKGKLTEPAPASLDKDRMWRKNDRFVVLRLAGYQAEQRAHDRALAALKKANDNNVAMRNDFIDILRRLHSEAVDDVVAGVKERMKGYMGVQKEVARETEGLAASRDDLLSEITGLQDHMQVTEEEADYLARKWFINELKARGKQQDKDKEE